MAITATDRGTGNSNAASSSIVVAPTTGDIAAGSTAILCIAMDNQSAPATNFTATSYTDSRLNLWRQRVLQVGGTPGSSVELAIYESILTSSFRTTDTLTIGLVSSSTVAKTWTLMEAAPAAGNQVLFANVGKAAGNAGVSASQNCGNPLLGDLAVGVVGIEGADSFTPDSDTTNGSWSTAQRTGVGTGATGMAIISQWKVTNTDSGQQTYDVTFTSADWARAGGFWQETSPKIRTLFSVSVAESSTIVPIWYPLTTGSIAVLVMSCGNQGSLGAAANIPPANSATIVDSQSNTWTQQKTIIYDPGAAGAGVEIGIYTSVLTHGLAITDTITLGTYLVNISVKDFILWEFAPTGAGAMTYVTGGVGSGSATGAPTVTSTSIASGDYIIGAAGAHGATSLNTWVGDSDTSNGNWAAQADISAGVTTGGHWAASQYKKVTAAGTQTYNPTFASAASIALWIEINDSSAVGGISAKQKASFFQMF